MNRTLDAISGKVLIDGRTWVTLSSAQRDRIARKAAALLVDSVNASSVPNGPRNGARPHHQNATSRLTLPGRPKLGGGKKQISIDKHYGRV